MPQVELSTAADLWSQLLAALKPQIPEQSFATWLQPLSPLRFEENYLWLAAPSHFHREWIEGHYSKGLEGALRELMNDDAAHVKLTVVPRLSEVPPLPVPPASVAERHEKSENSFESHLNSRYQFDRLRGAEE